MTSQNQILIDNYLGFLHSIERSYMINEQDYLIEMISKEKLVNLTQKQLKYIEKALIKMKVGVASVKAKAKSFSVKLKKDYDKGMSSDQASKQITSDAVSVVGKALYQVKDKVLEMSMGEKILVGICAFLIIIYINTVLGSIAVLTLGPEIGSTIISVIIAPMVEEAAKNFFIREKMPWVGTSIVFGAEALHYIYQLFHAGLGGLSKILILRLAAILMHFSTTYIQKKIIESGEDREFIAWIVGVGIHSSWNILGILLNQKIGAWMKR